MPKANIYVTQPFLPPLEEFLPYVEQIWTNKILTNNGPLHQQLETQLAEYLDVPYVVLVNNGMSALMLALQALELTGEVITTPYSFVATSHAIKLNNLEPVFVDIDPITLNLDPSKIEAAITENTSAILPVHCYGNPCDVKAIENLAKKYNLKVLYDAAHAFGAKDSGGSIVRYGDLSILSFHATKVFNTFEGGAVICHTSEMVEKLRLLRNFGIASETEIKQVGGNSKLSEIHAAMGLVQLKHIDAALEARAEVAQQYQYCLSNQKGVKMLGFDGLIQQNHAYSPILITEDYPLTRNQVYETLKKEGIHSRRYFYPLISNLKMYALNSNASAGSLPVANRVAEQVLCLPIYPRLEKAKVVEVTNLIKQA